MKRPARRNWSILEWAILAVSLGLAIFMLWQPLSDIVRIGLRDEEQNHIFLVPLVVAWLVWLRRSRLRSILFAPSVIGPAVVILGWLVSWYGFVYGVQAAWHGGAIVVLVGVGLTMTGLEVVRQLAPALIALAFLVPVPGLIRQKIAIPLQEIATTVTQSTLELIGVAATQQGSVLIINGEQVAVGEACNGMRMVFALTLVVYAFAFGTPLRTGTRIVLLLLSPVTALACNVIRLVPTSLFYGYGSPESAQAFHDAAGWIMLPIALFLLMGLLRVFKWLDIPVTSLRLAHQS